jgi:hypothetical protein
VFLVLIIVITVLPNFLNTIHQSLIIFFFQVNNLLYIADNFFSFIILFIPIIACFCCCSSCLFCLIYLIYRIIIVNFIIKNLISIIYGNFFTCCLCCCLCPSFILCILYFWSCSFENILLPLNFYYN